MLPGELPGETEAGDLPPREEGPDAEWVLPGEPLEQTIAFLRDRCGLRLVSLRPADDPREALLVGRGLRIRLDRECREGAGWMRIPAPEGGPGERMRAPNGTVVEFVPRRAQGPSSPARLESSCLTRADQAAFHEGRAGMQYRDLLPGRMGGHFVVSHIRIPDGGPVPDAVHFHELRFQMIFCLAGWVRVAYQDQGPDFVLEPGDLVVQPPGIRHRVLECSDGLEVLEVGTPAVHDTGFDPGLRLPDPTHRPGRRYAGQAFLRVRAGEQDWIPTSRPGLRARRFGVAVATEGRASVRILRASGDAVEHPLRHDAEFRMLYFLSGEGALQQGPDESCPVRGGDCLIVAPRTTESLRAVPGPLEWLELCLPAPPDGAG